MASRTPSKWIDIAVFVPLFAVAAYVLTESDQAGLYEIAR